MFVIDPYRSGEVAVDSGYSTGPASSVTSGDPLDDAWTGVADVDGAPNAAFATTFYQVDGGSQWLYASGFGLAVPTAAVITGLKVKAWYRITLTVGYGTNGADIELIAGATKDGSTFSGDTTILTLNPSSTPYETAPAGTFLTVESDYGLWGDTWSEADVEDSAFGFGLRTLVNLDDTNNNFAATIDAVEVTVQYEV